MIVVHWIASPRGDVVRFRYILSDTAGRKLTKKTTGRDATDYAAFSAARDARVTDVRLSDFNHLLNGYLPTETALPPRAFENALTAPGPILAAVVLGQNGLYGRARIEIKFDGRPDTTIVFFK